MCHKVHSDGVRLSSHPSSKLMALWLSCHKNQGFSNLLSSKLDSPHKSKPHNLGRSRSTRTLTPSILAFLSKTCGRNTSSATSMSTLCKSATVGTLWTVLGTVHLTLTRSSTLQRRVSSSARMMWYRSSMIRMRVK